MGVTFQDVLGLRALATTATTVTATWDVGVYIVDTTAGNVTFNLPDIDARFTQRVPFRDGSYSAPCIKIIRVTAGANTLTVDGFGSDTVNGGATAAFGTTQWSMKTAVVIGDSAWVLV